MTGGLLPPDVSPDRPYRVLARKYRPSTFADLLGQDAMVRTFRNAFALGRLRPAYLLSGVRGVGKTTTARILARAFLYDAPGHPGPSVDMPVEGAHCREIVEGRHPDVLELDAASHNGADDVREIVGSARFRPVRGRDKVFVIDEVHMLSRQAFDALAKVLEDPPAHVRFLLATTEAEKVPLAVRCRCQRHDLRRVDHALLVGHLAGICAAEGVGMGADVLSLVALASEGSVRDALSVLDQAIALGASTGRPLDAATLREMMGVADRSRTVDLFEATMRGDLAHALPALGEMHASGAEPDRVLADLAEFVHLVTRLKIVPGAADDPSLPPEVAKRAAAFAKALPMPALTAAWHALLRGMQEARATPFPLAAAEMTLARIAHASDAPARTPPQKPAA